MPMERGLLCKQRSVTVNPATKLEYSLKMFAIDGGAPTNSANNHVVYIMPGEFIPAWCDFTVIRVHSQSSLIWAEPF